MRFASETVGQNFRKIHFPNAFVIDYSERYNDNAGVGEFAMTLRQKADKLPDVKSSGGQRLGGITLK